jgi:hypothetical protein
MYKWNEKPLLRSKIALVICLAIGGSAVDVKCEGAQTAVIGARLSVSIKPEAALRIEKQGETWQKATGSTGQVFALEVKVRLNPGGMANIYLTDWNPKWGLPEVYVSGAGANFSSAVNSESDGQFLLTSVSRSGIHRIKFFSNSPHSADSDTKTFRIVITSSDSSFEPVVGLGTF